MDSKKIKFFNKLSFAFFLFSIFLSWIFFIPASPIFFEIGKGLILSLGIMFSLFFWLIARMGEGKFSLPKDRLFLFAGIIPLIFLLASFFSFSFRTSFWGNAFEIGTFISMLIMFFVFLLSAIYFQNEKRLWYFFGSLFLSALFLSLFEISNIFFNLGKFIPNLLKGVPFGNLVGNWGNFALFFGLIVLLAIYSIEFLKTKKLFLIILYFLLVSGIFFLIIVNLPLAWTLVGIFSAIIFIYSISVQNAGINIIHGAKEKKRFPLEALIVVFLCFFFLIGGNFIGNFTSQYIGVSNNDIRPSIVATSEIAVHSLKQNPLFGIGPNTFTYGWFLWQPAKVIQTDYWNTNFSAGFSFLATLPITVGILGFVSFLLFLITLLFRGIQSIRIALQDTLSNYFIFTTFMISVYTWAIVIFYNPNIVLLSLAFISSGVLVGILVFKQAILVKEFSFFKNPKQGFGAIFLLMILMIATIFLAYIFVEKFTALVYFAKSTNYNAQIEDLVRSEKKLLDAIALDPSDVFYRNLSQVYVGEMGLLANNQEISQEVLALNLQQLVNFAESSAQMAVKQNPKMYLNHLNLGNIYSSLVLFSVEGSYEKAVSAYNQAQKLAPQNPSVLLARSQLELANKNTEGAKKFIQKALTLKENYIDAIFFLAQIENDEGNFRGAIKQVEYAGKLSPNNPDIFFKLGILRYNNNDYNEAISAFKQAILLNPGYLDARYLLGRSYQKIGRNAEALAEYNFLKKIIPENEGLSEAIQSINEKEPEKSDETNNFRKEE